MKTASLRARFTCVVGACVLLAACSTIIGAEEGILDPSVGALAVSADAAAVLDATPLTLVDSPSGVVDHEIPDAGGGSIGDADAGGCGPYEKRCGEQCSPNNKPELGCATQSSCTPCAVAHATAACGGAGGACSIGACQSGHGDCNNDPADGCETDLSTSANCGKCNVACPPTAPFCAAAGDGNYACVTNCPASQPTLCTNTSTCSDTTKDPQHCGSCTNVCTAPSGGTATCNGTCDFVCNGGTHRCGGSCASNASSASCGPTSCTPCPPPPSGTTAGSAICQDPGTGTCGVACNAGYHRCGNDCLNNTSATSCGPSSCVACPAPPSGGGSATCLNPATGACSVSCSGAYHHCVVGGKDDCKSDTDVAFCGGGCMACPKGANVATIRCATNQCAVESCNTGYDDLDGDPTNGCETPNPRSIQPADLALWLRSDVGVVGDASGVSQWTDQSGSNDHALQTTTALRPTVVTGLWPGRPNLSVLKFDGSKELNVDLNQLASANGFSLFVADARYGVNVGSFIGAGVYNATPGCCTGDQGKMFQLWYNSINNYVLERTCTVIPIPIPANTAGTYQPRQSAVTFDTQLHITFGTATVQGDESGLPGFACIGTRPQAAAMAVNGKIGNSPANLPYQGLIGEVILYKRALAAADQAAVRAYLTAKFGVP